MAKKNVETIGQSVNEQEAVKPASAPVGKPKVVIAAYLHKPTMLPGGQTEGSLTQAKLPGIKLSWARGEGLIVEHKNQKAIIPAASVAIAYVDDSQD
jgi:hypothetical protein